VRDEFRIGEQLPELVSDLASSYREDERTHRLNKRYLPSRSETIEILDLLLALVYPGYHGRQDLDWNNVKFHTGEMLTVVGQKLAQQIYAAQCYQLETEGKINGHEAPSTEEARRLTIELLRRLPALREILAGDVQAAYDGDPAAVNDDEIIIAYPGLLAVSVYRIAHELYLMEAPLIPRVMSEHAHSVTAVDIHPGATIGRNFFIDHATGVVIGETTMIGDNVKLYQGVTLGARSFPKDERGRLIRGYKRHPTLEDGVTVYSNASILGDVVIGAGSVVGGSVFLTESVPPGCTVSLKEPELEYQNRRRKPPKRIGSDYHI
jgi:serine O-acetyltransferase